MTYNETESEERAGSGRANCHTANGHSPGPGHSVDRVSPIPVTSSSAGEESHDKRQDRQERMKLNAVKAELRRAELAFLSAKRVLRDDTTRCAAERVAEALGRCNLSIDTVEKGAAASGAIEALEGVSKFDPNTNLVEFLRVGGRSLALAARALANCSVASVEYWGRQLQGLADQLAHEPDAMAG